MLRPLKLLLMIGCVAPVAAKAQGPRKSAFGSGALPQLQIELTTDSVERLLKALPEISKNTSAQQAQFMGNLTGGGGQMPRMSEQQLNELQAIFKKHGFRMEEFAMQISALLATYLILSPTAFDKQLPSENKPEIRALLADPSVPQQQKDALRKQIAFARKNKGKIREQLSQLATDENKKVVRPMLAKVRKAFEAAEADAMRALKGSKPGPRRSKK